MNERDILAQKDFAVKEALLKGEAKGRTEGLVEGKRETAKNMLAKGFDKIPSVRSLVYRRKKFSVFENATKVL